MRLNYKRTFFVGLAFMAIQAFWYLYNHTVPLILKYTFQLPDGVSGWVMAADNVLALFLLPLFGMLSDKTRTKLGRRTPYILVGTLLSAALMMLIPFADWHKNLVLFVVALGFLLLAMSTYRSPAVALMPDVTPKPLRSKGNAIINLMGALGGIATYLIIAVLLPEVDKETGVKPASYTLVYGIIAGFMLLSAVVLVLTIRENKLVAQMPAEPEEVVETKKMSKPVLKSLIFMLTSVALWYMAYNAIETAYSRFVKEEWGISEKTGAVMMIVAMLVATASYVPIGIVSNKIGRKKAVIGGVLIMGGAFVIGCLMSLCGVLGVNEQSGAMLDWYVTVRSFFPYLAYVIMGLVGIGWAAISVNSYPMVVEMSRGSDIGKYTGYYYTFSMAAQVLTPILSGYLFEHLGYGVLFPYALLFTALAVVTMLLVKHGDVKAEKKESLLESFDVED